MENTEKKLTYVAKLSLSSEHLPTPQSTNQPSLNHHLLYNSQ